MTEILPESASAAVLTANAMHASMDRKTLTKLNYRSVTVLGTAAEAVSFLAANPVGIVLVDARLADMAGCDFIRALKREKGGRLLPVVMVTLENRRESVLDAIAAGCSGYVLRPYSYATFERHLAVAKDSYALDEIESEQLANAQELVDRGQFDEAIQEFEEIVTARDEASRYFDLGMKHLAEQKYGKAIIAFNKAVKLNELYAEAFKGLADAHKGKGDMAAYEEHLKRAAEVYAIQDRLQEAKDIFVEILRRDPNAVNPYNSLGVSLRKKGDYPGALHAYVQALELSPTDENLRYNMAKAYLYAQDKDKAVEQLAAAIRINPGFTEAAKLHAKLTGQAFTPPHAAAASDAVAPDAASASLLRDE